MSLDINAELLPVDRVTVLLLPRRTGTPVDG